jgi:hypothetical protein
MAVPVVNQLVQAAVEIIKEALLRGQVHPAVELDERGIGIVEQDHAAVVSDEPAGAHAVTEGSAVLTIEGGVVGDGVAIAAGVCYCLHRSIPHIEGLTSGASDDLLGGDGQAPVLFLPTNCVLFGFTSYLPVEGPSTRTGLSDLPHFRLLG